MSYVIKRNVPILDEHTLEDDDGKPLIQIDARRLEDIAARANQRVQTTGDEIPIIIGHTNDEETSEQRQPEVVGYARDFKVGRLFNSGRRAIKATFKFFKDKINKVKKYPRRSIELWLSDWKIDPISLLGPTTPERDLGLLRLSRDGSKRWKYSHVFNEDKKMAADAKAIATEVMAMIKETEEWKWIESQMEEDGDNGPLDDLEGDLPLDDDLTMDDGDIDAGDMDDDFEGDFPPMDEPPVDDDREVERYMKQKYGAGYGSATNGFIPSAGRKKCSRRRHSRQDEITRIRRDQERVRYARQERAIEGLRQENQKLKLKFQRADREKDLVQLEAEGLLFDRAEELDSVTGMTEENYRRHLAKMRKRYQRAPVGGHNFAGGPGPEGGPTKTLSREQMKRILDYAQKNDLSFDQARSQIAESETLY